MTQQNYTVSALKYRPSSWDTIIGQDNISTTLDRLLKVISLLKLIYFVVLEELEKLLLQDFLQKKLT